MADSRPDTLAAILGCSLQRAGELLREADGVVETAVALHFALPGRAGPSARPDSPRSQLRAIVGPLSEQRVAGLLRRAGGSVERAVDLFFEEAEEAGPSAPRGEPSGPESGPISIDDDSEGEVALTANAGRARSAGLARSSGGGRGSGRARSAQTVQQGVGGTSGRGRRQQRAAPSSGLRTAQNGRQLAATRGASAPAARQAEQGGESVAEADSSSEEESSSDSDSGGPGPGPGPGLPGAGGAGLPGAALTNIFSNLRWVFGGPVETMETDSEDEEEEEEAGGEAAEEARHPRNSGNAKVAEPVPSLQAAAAFKVHTQALPNLPAARLPLPSMRSSKRRLYSDGAEGVPAAAVPPQRLQLPLRLGSVLLPLHWLDPAAKDAVRECVWGSQQRGSQEQGGSQEQSQQCKSEFQALRRQEFFQWRVAADRYKYTNLLTAFGRTSTDETTARLVLFGKNDSPAAMVWDNNSWVAGFLHALFTLQRRGDVGWTATLHSDAAPGAAGRGRLSGARAAAAAQGRGASRSSGRAAARGTGRSGGQSQQEAAGTKARGKGGSGEAGLSSAGPSGSTAAHAPGSPTHLRVEVTLLPGAKRGLWWSGSTGDLEEGGEEEEAGDSKWPNKKERQRRTKQRENTALGRLVAVLLQFGEGLSVGPDADGLLNFGDTPRQAYEQLPPRGTPAFRKLFDVGSLLAAVMPDRSAPPAVAPPGLSAHPKHYQLQGLQWMLDRERKGDAVGRGQLHLHPAWLQLVAPGGQLLYLHRLQYVLSDCFYTAPVGGTAGGLLADEMGLGKTLQTLMLVMSNPAPPGWAVEEIEGRTAGGEGAEEAAVPVKTTLIVVPSNLLEQWADEIERHLHPGAITWATFKPGLKPQAAAAPAAAAPRAGGRQAAPQQAQRRSRRMQEMEMQVRHGEPVRPIWCQAPDGSLLELHRADLVLMSYESMRDELNVARGHSSLLHSFGFWRIVLDEAQLVANTSSVAAVAASSLWRRQAWVVSGTPVSSRLDEVRGLLTFLACEPFYHSRAWRGLVLGEYDARSAAGLLSMRALLRGVMLRRSKADVADELNLPPCTREDRWVPLSSVERLVYEQARRSFVDTAFHLRQHQQAVAHQGLQGSSRQSSHAVGRAMQALTALRQSCCHPQIVRRQDDVLGKERLSMRQIMAKLVCQSYNEWDSTARSVCLDKALLAAVLLKEGAHPGEALRQLLELVQWNSDVSLSIDIPQAAAHRCPDGGRALHGSAARGGGDAVDAPQQQQQQQAVAEQAANGEAAATAGGARAGRKRSREAEEESSAGNQQQQQPEQQQQAGGSTLPNGLANGVGPRRRRSRSRSAMPAAAAPAAPAAGEGAATGGAGGPEPSVPAAQQQQQQQQQRAQRAQQAGAPEGEQPREPKGKEKAGEQPAQGPGAPGGAGDGGKGGPAMSEEERERHKDARRRWRHWQHVELDLLELYAHLLQRCLHAPAKARGRSSKRARSEAGPSSASGSGAAAAAPDKEAVEAELQEATVALERLRQELDMAEGPGIVRRSKRQAGVDTDEEILLDEEEAEAVEQQLLNAKLVLRHYGELLKKKDPEKSARTALAHSEKQAAEKWHHLQHLLNKEAALVAAEKGKAAVTEQQAGTSGGGGLAAVQQEDLNSCPICLDDLTDRTITACGHHYCPVCIREVIAHGNRQCPICRAPIREADLFDACSEEEARLKERAAHAGRSSDEYGSKVSALLAELAVMKAADPGAKAVVFSSWGRLLKLVGDGLKANGVDFASLCGSNLQQRQAALHRFMHDPGCSVLTVVMSTAGGAAGLTLTVASTAFIMEPAFNPGLEAQAAARIYRLGQTRSTRVIRLLAEDSVESRVLDIQRRKLEAGDEPAETALQEIDSGMILHLYDSLK